MTLHRALPILATLTLLGACGAPPRARPAAPELDAIASSLFARNAVPGMAVAVVRDGEIAFAKGYGWADVEARRPMTPDTVFYIASSTKTYVGLAAALLVARGQLDLDAPLSRLLPAAALHASLRADAITLRALLTHTHGIDNSGPVTMRASYVGDLTRPELQRLLAEHPAASTGTAFEYGNIGYIVASLAIEAAAGASWQDLVRRELLAPLGLDATTAYPSRVAADRLAQPYRATTTGFERIPYGKADGNMTAAGGLVTSPRDLGRWLAVHITRGVVGGRRVLPEAAFVEAHRKHADARDDSLGWRMYGYGLGWEIADFDGEHLLVHDGSGFQGFATHLSFMPERRLGVIVMANEQLLGGVFVDQVAHEFYRALTGLSAMTPASLAPFAERIQQHRDAITADRARRAARPQTLPHPRSAYAGAFDNPHYGRIELALAGDALEARYGHARSPVEVFDAAQNKLRVELTGTGNTVTVTMRDGRAASITVFGQTFTRAGE